MNIDIEKLDKNISLESFITLCKIPGIGPSVAKKIAEKVKNATTLRDLLEEKQIEKVLYEVNGLGKIGIKNIVDELLTLDFMLLLEELESEGFNMFTDTYIYSTFELIEKEKEEKVEPSEISLSFCKDLKGYNICITGTLSLPRKFFENFIRTNGGKFQTMVTNDTDILIYSNADGISTAKYTKAKQIQKYKGEDKLLVITESEFMNSVKKMK